LAEPGGLLLAAKIAAAVIVVVAASRATERAGPFLGAMIATLPVSTGPVYVFLALDHGAALVDGLKGLLGFGFALAVLHLAAARMSATAALLLALAVAVGWNTVLTLLSRR
jgi:hypothetical protein